MKEHFNAEYHPLIDCDDTPVILLIPPPPLHCLLLGPGNLVWDALEETCTQLYETFLYFIDIDLFEDKLDYNGEKEFEKENPVQKLQRKLCLVKEPYHGQVYNGRQLNKIFHHLDLLTTDFCVPKHLECFVTCLENLQLLHEGVSGVKLDPNYDNLIDNFMTSFEVIHKEFGVSYTNKVHIIESHLKYYFKTTNKSLGYYSDQLVEAMHSEADTMLSKSGYKVNDFDSEVCGEKLLSFIKHFNSYNL